jgi:outer membrane protein TolC
VLLKLNNPELASFDFELQSAKNAIVVAEKKFFPDFGIGVKKERGIMSENGTRDAVMMMFSLNVPIWRGNYEAAKLQAKAQAEQIRQERINTENSIAAQAAQALYDFEDSNRRVHLYGDILISKAQELITNSETAYKAGTIDFLDLVDAQRMLLEYRLAYERAIADNAQRLAELEMLTGSTLADLHTGSGNQDAHNLPVKH